MKRILFVHHNSFIGGASYCLLGIVKNIDRYKFEPVVALRDDGPLVGELKKEGVKVVLFQHMATIPYNRSLFSRGCMRAYMQVKRSLGLFEELLRQECIDIVYFNNLMLASYLQPSKTVGCRTILHVREHWPLDEHTKQLARIQRMIYNHCDQLIAINHFSAGMFPHKSSTIVYDWIDMARRYKNMPFNDIFGEDVSKKKVFLYVGGMARIKGAYEVIKTFVDRLKGDDYRLLVLGFTKEISSEGLNAKIRKLLHVIGVPLFEYKVKQLAQRDNRITCIPFVYELSHLVQQAYCELSYFTIPHANLPLAEAIIMGTPVIAARTDESEEYSLNGKLAKLFRMNDIDDFNNSIADFIRDDSELRVALASQEKEKVVRMFSEEENMKKINHVLESSVG